MSWLLKRAIAITEGDQNPGVAEANNVRRAGASYVRNKARVIFHAPSAGDISEVCDDGDGLVAEGAIPVAEGHVHSGISETNDVGESNLRGNCQQARMIFHPPSGVIPEVRDHGDGLVAEGAVPVAEGHVHSGISETNDVGESTLRGDRQQARVFFHAPSAGVVSEDRKHGVGWEG